MNDNFLHVRSILYNSRASRRIPELLNLGELYEIDVKDSSNSVSLIVYSVDRKDYEIDKTYEFKISVDGGRLNYEEIEFVADDEDCLNEAAEQSIEFLKNYLEEMTC